MAEEKDPPEDQDEELDEDEEEGADSDDSEDDGKDDEDGEDDSDDGDDDDVVPVRRSALLAKDHIITRQKRSIEKLRSKKPDEDQEDKDEEGNDDRGSIADEIKRQLDPVRKVLTSTEDERELVDLYKSNPEAKKYDRAIRKRMENPAWAQIPIASIYRDLAFDKSSGKNQERRRVADLEASQSRSGGSQRRQKTSSKFPELDNLDSMSDKDIEKIEQDARSGKFLNR